MRSLPRLPRAVLLLAVVTVACSAREAPPPETARGVQIAGELNADGSCRVSVSGASVFAPGDGARTFSLAGRTVNMAPPGHELHELWCAPGTKGEPMIPDTPGERALLITLYPRAGAALRAGRYSVVRDIPTDGGSAAETHAGLSLFDPAHVSAGGRSGIAYLAADSGSVTLTRVDGTRVVGTFSVRATQSWTM